jgi:hypothetical protein
MDDCALLAIFIMVVRVIAAVLIARSFIADLPARSGRSFCAGSSPSGVR